ncbi:MAG: PorT family protein [Gemmatimonadales bacterium]|nr:PorT family protein [Gemmatimonadales bacterium]MYG50507.1 PorT family protein [Gemmatimonadales bacterium]MYK02056.1 PorT family protein [Candidatus Palauibacter ramosifaciens]
MRCKLMSTCLTLLLLPSALTAQIAIRGGLHGHLPPDDYNRSPGPQVMVETAIPFSGGASLRPGLSYASRGFGLSDGIALFEVNSSHLQLSGLVHASTSGSVGLAAEVGPYLGFRVGCDVSFGLGAVSRSESCADLEDQELDYKKVDMGIVAGLGAFFDVSETMTLTLGVQVYEGLTPFTEADEEYTKLSAVSLLAGVEIGG